ncbi:MAG: MauE/DoxX family redox-associated membrane protein [Streptosporangiaceae bacterium]
MTAEAELLRRVQPWVTTCARLVLAGVFAASGVIKASAPVQTVVSVESYDIVHGGLASIIGYGLPFLELALAALLLVGLGTRVVSVVGGVLLLVFVAGIASVWARGLSIDCGCFGGGGQVAAGETHYLREILRDIGLVILAAWVVTFPSGRFGLDGAAARLWAATDDLEADGDDTDRGGGALTPHDTGRTT